MNQNFNKKTIEAAVRTAMFNKENKIYINGNRSKVRYYLYFDGDTIYLCYDEDDYVHTWFQIGCIPQTRAEREALVTETTNIIARRLMGKEELTVNYQKRA